MNDTPLTGCVAVVTGSGRGIGRAIAIGLAKSGASVVVTARTSREIESVRSEIEALGGTAVAIPSNVGDRRDAARLVDESRRRFGAIDILVNNAAVVWPIVPSRSVNPDRWAEALEINLIGAVRLSFGVLPDMLERGWGRIVNVSSEIVVQPTSMMRANAYATSKAALEAHTVCLAAELRGTGVTVNAYRPGGVDTAMQAWIREQPVNDVGAELQRQFIKAKESRTLLTPEESAAALLPRISSAATGEIWSVRDSL
jgi:NAD(P)-dependent dehydrogenase (short-subunit alcohol dehydrogenase family)